MAADLTPKVTPNVTLNVTPNVTPNVTLNVTPGRVPETDLAREPALRPRNPGRVDGLTVVRGVAIALVLVRHLAPGFFGGAGIVGVTIFFALSGWLITGILLGDLERGGRVRLRRFFVNRVWRLYPALLLFTAVLAGVGILWDPLSEGGTWVRAVLVALTYTADLPVGIDVGSASTHLWTLAVEEQFYLLWPFLLSLGFRRGGGTRGGVRRTVLGAVVLCWAAAVATAVLTWDEPARAYGLPTSWFVALAVGGFARTLDRRRLVRWVDRRGIHVAAVVLLGLTCVVPDLKGNPLTYLLGGPVIAVAAVVLVVAALRFDSVRHPLGRVLVGLGTISYAVYLWNYALVVWTEAVLDEVPGIAARAVATVVTLVAALVSWYLLELPVARRRRAAARPATLVLPAP